MNKRDKEVKIMLDVISTILHDQADIRLGQLLANLSHPVDPFYISDQDLLNNAIAYLEQITPPYV